MSLQAYYALGKIHLTRVRNPAIGKPIHLGRLAKDVEREAPQYLYLGAEPEGRTTTSEAFLTSEECRGALDRNDLGDFSVLEVEVVPVHFHPDKLFVSEKEPKIEAGVVVWEDATLQVPIYDLPAGLALDCVQQPLDVNEFWFYVRNGFRLATVPVGSGAPL